MRTASDNLPAIREDFIVVYGPTFTAGLILHNGKAVIAAPVLGWLKGWHIDGLIDVFTKKKWKWEYVLPNNKKE